MMRKLIFTLIAILGCQICAYSQINIDLAIDEKFKQLAIQLTNQFDNEIILSILPPALAENRNSGVRVDFRNNNDQVILTWTYPLRVVNREFHSAFPIPAHETILVEPNLSDISKKHKNELKSIKVFLGFLILNPTTQERFKVWESFVLDDQNYKLNAKMTLGLIN